MASGAAHEAVRREILGEKTSALSTAIRALESALAAIGRARPEERREAVAEAGERLWYVVVQREAMGLHRHDILYEILAVPGEVRGAMGPRRRR